MFGKGSTVRSIIEQGLRVLHAVRITAPFGPERIAHHLLGPGGMVFLRCNGDHHCLALIGGLPETQEMRKHAIDLLVHLRNWLQVLGELSRGLDCLRRAEALAELWHKRMRQELGFGSEDATKIRDLFHQGYRGSRYSFGYPACPDLEQREKIIELLKPTEVGVTLSENYMLVPEQSTDALVAHHPQAKYFDV